nr:MAG TPA: hypothetical protein [Caudoviricetes sp.]
MKIDEEIIFKCLRSILRDVDYYGQDGKDAERTLCYINGVVDMATELINRINEQREKQNQELKDVLNSYREMPKG